MGSFKNVNIEDASSSKDSPSPSKTLTIREQKSKWLDKISSSKAITAIACSTPRKTRVDPSTRNQIPSPSNVSRDSPWTDEPKRPTEGAKNDLLLLLEEWLEKATNKEPIGSSLIFASKL